MSALQRNRWSPGTLGTGLLLLGAVILRGCGSGSEPAPVLIRLADPGRIASVDSEHWDLLKGESPVFAGARYFSELDQRSRWVPFPAAVLSEDASGAQELPPVQAPERSGDLLHLEPQTGIALLVPLRGGRRIYVECRGSFGSAGGMTVTVAKLSTYPILPRRYDGKTLLAVLEKHGLNKVDLTPSADGRSAAGIVFLQKGVQGMFLMVTNRGEQEGTFERARSAYVTARHDFLLGRRERGPAHPALALDPFIEHTTQPSLFLPPRTSITLKEVEIGEGAELRCALGVIDNEFPPVEVSMTARERGGRESEIFRERLMTGRKAWIGIDCDLSAFAGKTLQLVLTSAMAGEGEMGEAPVPLVFCGSPILHHEIPPGKDPGLNLVLISLDTLRRDHLGCYGYERLVSPNMDRLARESILFKNVYSHAPHTLASHASLFTSLHPSSHGTQSEGQFLPDRAELLSEVLARSGLATASFNNGGFVSHEFGFHRGFDLYCEVDPIGDRTTDGKSLKGSKLSDGSESSLHRALAWIDGMREERFFLFLHTFLVHGYQPPRELGEEFNAGCRSALKVEPGVEALSRPEIVKEQGLSPEDLEFFINMYDGTIKAADAMVAEVIALLKARGLWERTLLVITSDHGEEFMEHGSVRHGKTVYEEVIQVPLILHVPGMAGGVEVEGAVPQVDVMPTLLELMGIEAPKEIQGRSLIPMIEGGGGRDRTIFAETFLPDRAQARCIIKDGWKYIEGNADRALQYPAPAPAQLFRLAEDPLEKQCVIDLGGEPGDLKSLKEALERMEALSRQAREKLWQGEGAGRRISEELTEILRQQGYL